MSSGFWDQKKVLVTGHTGFKGAWLCLCLLERGASVLGYSLEPPTDPNLYEFLRLDGELESVHGDVLDLNRILDCFRRFKPDIAIHLAAQSLVGESYLRPVDTYAVNVLGTVHFLECLRDSSSVRAGIVVTSDKCYKDPGSGVPHREDDPLGGRDPYSSSKGGAELAVAAYRESFPAADGSPRCAIASVRAGNVIGGGDWAKDRLIPDMVRAFHRKEPVVLRNPNAVRPWQHVLEPVSGYVVLAERLWDGGLDYAEAWNFGPLTAEEMSVSHVASRFAVHWGNGAKWIASDQAAFPETGALRLDSTKALRRLGWKPKLDLETSIDWTARWYKGYERGEDLRQICEQQAKEYRDRP